MPPLVDVAFELKRNVWRGERRLQLELKALREHTDYVRLSLGSHSYLACHKPDKNSSTSFHVMNASGDILVAEIDHNQNLVCQDQRLSDFRIQSLLQGASLALGLQV